MNRIKRVVIAVAVACGLAGAGSTHAEVDDLWPTFAVGAGGYWIDTTDEVRIDGSLGAAGRQIDLQADLGLPDSKTLIQADLVWAFAERHSVELGYYSLERKGSRSLAREVEIGDTVFPVGATASASFETTAIEAAYTYWFVRHGISASAARSAWSSSASTPRRAPRSGSAGPERRSRNGPTRTPTFPCR